MTSPFCDTERRVKAVRRRCSSSETRGSLAICAAVRSRGGGGVFALGTNFGRTTGGLLALAGVAIGASSVGEGFETALLPLSALSQLARSAMTIVGATSDIPRMNISVAMGRTCPANSNVLGTAVSHPRGAHKKSAPPRFRGGADNRSRCSADGRRSARRSRSGARSKRQPRCHPNRHREQGRSASFRPRCRRDMPC